LKAQVQLGMATLAGAAALTILPPPLGAEVRAGRFPSAALGRDVSYAVDLPASYDGDARRYPVVYTLHGLFESPGFWEGRGLGDALARLRARGGFADFIVVAVEGGNSFYVNGPAGRHEDVVTRDAIAFVEKAFRVVPGREGRGLLGVSMGGYAALRIAFTHPELYRAVATHSAMLLEKPPTAEQGARGGQMAAFHRVFGDPLDTALWAANDPLALATKLDPRAAPSLYFDCGTADRYGLAAGNSALHQRLTERGIPHTFSLNPGDHGYEYVLAVIEDSLRFLSKALGGAMERKP
jgi:S-formylglutathione hydrolase FrmB